MIVSRATLARTHKAFEMSSFAGVLEQLSRSAPRVHSRQPEHMTPSNLNDDIKGRKKTTIYEPELVSEARVPWKFDRLDESDHSTKDDEIMDEVSETLLQALDAQDIWKNGREPDSVSLEDERLTPAQRFYLENRELLVKRAVAYSLDQAKTEFEKATSDIEDEWKFYRDPIVRPERGFLWPIHEGCDTESNTEIPTFEHGRFPSVEELVSFLEAENIGQIIPVDLESCGRRDIGEWAIIGTAKSAAHARRVGNLARRKINNLELDHVKCFMNTGIPGQEWVVTRLGSIVVHLMTETDRARYRLEDIYSVPVHEESEYDSLEGHSQSDSTDLVHTDIQ